MKDNELIAEFMGGIRDKNGNDMFLMPNGIGPYEPDVYSLNEMIYHTSWDWLMPVVEKCYMINSNKWRLRFDAYVFLSIDQCYKEVVEFIKNHNQQNQ